jgi:hypothetical protein
MTDNSPRPPAGGPAWPLATAPPPPPRGRPLLSVVVILVGSALLGLGGGALWSAAAPRVVYQVFSLKPPTAYAVNPETSAFIAADGWFCFIGLAGGALIGLLSYLFAVRRYGPAPMVAVVIGSTAAGFLAQWFGHLLSGGPGFDRVLAASKLGEVLHAPIALGSHGALAFWPLAAAVVAGGLELISYLRGRHQAGYGRVPMPGVYYDQPPAPGQPGSGGWPGQPR